eukprot:CAMPEP_0206436330 /NCGR_PEP_ID=MMETSP0324_2-20121206/10419_1 /ASSEMBLY_ACC=CAM_ASM_000836 /TAXON_ID=2866 /ORGANISM="Crypthecodinium cohnii, Strain Seligo" /LENGTH=141 /DNA_ID=CAMNT_0053903475 /DNA_START=354 /DNA_END=779 /DNA_ORIENTATION=-
MLRELSEPEFQHLTPTSIVPGALPKACLQCGDAFRGWGTECPSCHTVALCLRCRGVARCGSICERCIRGLSTPEWEALLTARNMSEPEFFVQFGISRCVQCQEHCFGAFDNEDAWCNECKVAPRPHALNSMDDESGDEFSA